MNGPAWNHRRLEANGIGIHYVRHGAGPPLVVLHGWLESIRVYYVMHVPCDLAQPSLQEQQG